MLLTTVSGNRCPARTDDEGAISIGEIQFRKPPSAEAVEVSGSLRCDDEDWQHFLIAKRQVVKVEARKSSWGVICHVPYSWPLTFLTVEEMLSSCLGIEHWINVGPSVACQTEST